MRFANSGTGFAGDLRRLESLFAAQFLGYQLGTRRHNARFHERAISQHACGGEAGATTRAVGLAATRPCTLTAILRQLDVGVHSAAPNGMGRRAAAFWKPTGPTINQIASLLMEPLLHLAVGCGDEARGCENSADLCGSLLVQSSGHRARAVPGSSARRHLHLVALDGGAGELAGLKPSSRLRASSVSQRRPSPSARRQDPSAARYPFRGPSDLSSWSAHPSSATAAFEAARARSIET